MINNFLYLILLKINENFNYFTFLLTIKPRNSHINKNKLVKKFILKKSILFLKTNKKLLKMYKIKQLLYTSVKIKLIIKLKKFF